MNAAAVQPERLPVAKDEVRRILLPEIHESTLNPRQHYDETALKELASSLLATGQLTPIVVRSRKAGGYEIAAGHRRYRAALLALKVQPDGAKFRGLGALLAVIRELSDKEFIEVLNIENLQRDDLHPLEEATGFRDLMEKAGYDVAKIAARIGRSDRYVYDSLTLLKLIPEGKKLFLAGAFERGHAIELARLTPEQQRRALDVTKNGAELGDDSLLLEPDSAAEEEDELPLQDRVKPVSVREFKHAIQRRIRATPDGVDPFLFPESVKALEAAKEETLSVIHITREYLATDEVRQSDDARVFGSQAWKRADGGIEENERTGRKERSKPCDWSRYGFVASGPGQGEVFRVCINKDKCHTHWPEQAKRAEQRRQDAKKAAKAPPRVRSASEQKSAEQREQARQEKAEAERKAGEQREAAMARAVPTVIKQRAPAIAARILAIRKDLRATPAMAAFLWNEGLEPVEQDLISGYGTGEGSRYGDEILEAVSPLLPGKTWGKGLDGQLSAIASVFWFNQETKGLDKEIQKAAAALVDAELKAKAAQKAPKPPPKKKGGRK